MQHYYILPTCLLLAISTAHAQNPLAIPPALDMDTFNLVLNESSHEFYPGVVTQTYGISAPFLGATLILHKGDTARFRVTNQLSEDAGMHWNGMEVPPEFDGSPPLVLQPGETWDVKYKVIDKASVYVYHPHTMGLIGQQVNKGAAGRSLCKMTKKHNCRCRAPTAWMTSPWRYRTRNSPRQDSSSIHPTAIRSW